MLESEIKIEEKTKTVEKTGSWRVFKPVIDTKKCTKCNICYASCPDNCISKSGKDFPSIDFSVCTGCLICVRECPYAAISEEKE